MSSNLRSKVIPIITILCAVGVGVTGTLLWSQSQSSSVPTPTPTSAAPVASNLPDGIPSNIPLNMPNNAPVNSNAPLDATEHTPPPMLTANLKGPEASLTLGNWYYDHEQWTKAIEHYRLAIKGGIDNANVRTDMGNALRFIDKPREALDQYRIAQREDPTHEQSLYNQGGLWAFALNDSKQAVAAWKMYIQRFPKGQSVEEAKKFIAEHEKKD